MVSSRLLNRLGHSSSAGEIMPGIDGVRAVAVCLVVFFHLYVYAGRPGLPAFDSSLGVLFRAGFTGVDLFFVLSGFLLMLPWAKSHHLGTPAPSWRTYYKRRILRIVPAYYVHLFVLTFIMVPAVYSFHLLFSPLGALITAAHLTFTQYFFPSASAGWSINGALWTLSIEAQFYLLLPWIASRFARHPLAGLALALSIACVWKFLAFHGLDSLTLKMLRATGSASHDPFVIQQFLAHQFPSQAFHFAVGMALATHFARRHFALRDEGRMAGFAGSFLIGAGLILIFGLMHLLTRVDLWHSWWLYAWYPLAALACGLLVWSAAFPNPAAVRLLGAPTPRLIGLISYSIYLWHLPVIYFVKNYMMPSGLHGMSLFLTLSAVCLPIILLLAFYSYRHIELPFMRRRDRQATVRSGPVRETPQPVIESPRPASPQQGAADGVPGH